MCTVSMIGDHYGQRFPGVYPWATNPVPVGMPAGMPAGVSKEEFDALKKEVENMKELLTKAKEYDEKNNEPHCEMEEKVELLKKIAKLVVVDLSIIFDEM